MEQLDAVAAPLGVKNTTDVTAVSRLDERDLQADQLVEITVEAPIQDPRGLDPENGRGRISGTRELRYTCLRRCRLRGERE